MQAPLTRLVTTTIPQNEPCFFFDDRETMMNPFGGDSGWQSVTGKHGGSREIPYLCPSALALTSYTMGLSFNTYFPTLTATMGYSPTITLLLCAPPLAFATIVAFIVASHSTNGRAYLPYHNPFHNWDCRFYFSSGTMNIARGH
jgi:hypothetical protein